LEDKISIWLKIAEDDIETAEACFENRRYLWMMVTCQQAVEKVLKAFYIKEKQLTPPKVHDLFYLAEKAELVRECSTETLNLFDTLTRYYFGTRYPDKRIKLEGQCSGEFAKTILAETKEVLAWLLKKLKK
jgi:HEPN domain-containing protein